MSFLLNLDPSVVEWLTATWSPTHIPSQTTLSYVDPTNIPGLEQALVKMLASALAATEIKQLYFLQREHRAVQASLTLASAQEYLQNATETQNFPQITEVIFNATLNLISLNTIENPYGAQLNIIPNLLFAILFAILFIYNFCLLIKSKQVYFSICFMCGTGLEFAGYISRSLAVNSLMNTDLFLCQIISLTMAPAFIMAGIYILLAQLIVIHGQEYSLLKPLWFSYIFITFDFISLFIQAGGGGMAGSAIQTFDSTTPGTHVMVAGVLFQLLTMSFFLMLLFDFIFKIYFKSHENVEPSLVNFFKLFFNSTQGRYYKGIQEESFPPKYEKLRQRRLVQWLPLIILVSVLFIYIRCIYRVVELFQGWTGYLVTHEVYVFTLDALLVLICCLLYVVFHPGIVFGGSDELSVKDIKRAHEEEYSEEIRHENEEYSKVKRSHENEDYSEEIRHENEEKVKRTHKNEEYSKVKRTHENEEYSEEIRHENEDYSEDIRTHVNEDYFDKVESSDKKNKSKSMLTYPEPVHTNHTKSRNPYSSVNDSDESFRFH